MMASNIPPSPPKSSPPPPPAPTHPHPRVVVVGGPPAPTWQPRHQPHGCLRLWGRSWQDACGGRWEEESGPWPEAAPGEEKEEEEGAAPAAGRRAGQGALGGSQPLHPHPASPKAPKPPQSAAVPLQIEFPASVSPPRHSPTRCRASVSPPGTEFRCVPLSQIGCAPPVKPPQISRQRQRLVFITKRNRHSPFTKEPQKTNILI